MSTTTRRLIAVDAENLLGCEPEFASGHHIFCESVRALSDAGVPTTVAGLPTQTSSEVTATATNVTWLDRPERFLDEAATVGVAPAELETFALAPVYADPMLILWHTDLALAA